MTETKKEMRIETKLASKRTERDDSRSHTVAIVDETLNAVTHGLAALFAVYGLILLLNKAREAGSTTAMVAFSIYSATLILLFLISCLRHSLYFSRANKVFQVLDHNSIFLLIAGNYTPYCLLALTPWIGWSVLIVVWICAIVGIVLTSVFLPRWNKVPKLATGLYVVMGWVIILAIYPLWQSLPHSSFWLLIGGGVIYSVGAAIYHYKFPFAHLIWHIFVMAAAWMMWLSVYGLHL